MATTLQQLLDDLTDRAAASPPTATTEDAAGALAHLGRALSGLAHDGLTAADSARQRTAVDLSAACATAGRLWPHTGGPLTDLAGATADLIGRDRTSMGRSHRWAVIVTVAEAADNCARLGRRLLPHAAVAEMSAVHRLAAAVERDAQIDPPTAAGYAILDRPVPGRPFGGTAVTVVDASAALIMTLDRAQRAGDLTLRDFRAAVAAAEITSRSAATITAATTGDGPGPHVVTALAWQLTGRASMVFHDGQRAGVFDPGGVVAPARDLAGALRRDVGTDTDSLALCNRPDLPRVASEMRQVSNQLPMLAERLNAAVDRWADTGRVYAAARDLPPVEDMPEDRVLAVIAGRHVPARGADLAPLRRAVMRAADLSAGQADALNGSGGADPMTQRHLAVLHAGRVQAPGTAEGLLAHAQAVEHAVAAHYPAPSSMEARD